MTDIAAAPHRPDLGWPLKAWLGFVLLANLWVAYRLGMTIDDLVSHHDPLWHSGDLQWALPALLATTVVQLIAVGLLFLRLRVGFYVIIGCTVAALAINLAIGVPLGTNAIGLVGAAVTVVLVRQRWHVMR